MEKKLMECSNFKYEMLKNSVMGWRIETTNKKTGEISTMAFGNNRLGAVTVWEEIEKEIKLDAEKHICEHCEKEFTEIKFNENYCSIDCADASENEYNERIGDAWPGY